MLWGIRNAPFVVTLFMCSVYVRTALYVILERMNIRLIWRKMRIKRIPVYGRTNMSQLGEH